MEGTWGVERTILGSLLEQFKGSQSEKERKDKSKNLNVGTTECRISGIFRGISSREEDL